MDDLHELIWARDDALPFQQIFKVYPELERFETKDLWREHPAHKGLWKIIGRLDDYVYLSHADGLHASSLEPEITAHPTVKSAVIGGHGQPAPVLLVELNPGTEYRDAALYSASKCKGPRVCPPFARAGYCRDEGEAFCAYCEG
jgi:hypothetical protein